MSFDSLGLLAELRRAIATQGYTTPTPIQRQAIPVILAGRDVLAGAQTGTGKTAAFTLPMLQRLHTTDRIYPGRGPRALILTPTRELAAQVGDSIATYGEHLPLRSTVIFGGVAMPPQVERLRRGVELLTATPGRLLDHAGQRTLDLSGVEILVLDEADRMLDMGFIHDIRRVLKLLPPRRQNLLFSATYSNEIEQLASGLLQDPALLAVARRNTAAEGVAQSVHLVDKARKRDLLSHLILDGGWKQVLVFTRTKHGANRLAEQLVRDGITAAAIHGNKSQNARTRALTDFKRGDVRALVATDIAARGLDIDRLPHVVNFELPNVPEDYVHRIGRTGRAGSDGSALSLVCPEEHKLLIDIQRLLKREIPTVAITGFDYRSPAAPTPSNGAAVTARDAGTVRSATQPPRARRRSRPAQGTNPRTSGERR
ncbi:DEAD/DEAH box helicase [Thioalkalicoccus limnaeus]|uniref:DEAD/DEAH box helicase n=1 Tax=Thioalkalicoccus limnaeus TaxID=120681 RepID=A0ABV4BD32_9GAMM